MRVCACMCSLISWGLSDKENRDLDNVPYFRSFLSSNTFNPHITANKLSETLGGYERTQTSWLTPSLPLFPL